MFIYDHFSPTVQFWGLETYCYFRGSDEYKTSVWVNSDRIQTNIRWQTLRFAFIKLSEYVYDNHIIKKNTQLWNGVYDYYSISSNYSRQISDYDLLKCQSELNKGQFQPYKLWLKLRKTRDTTVIRRQLKQNRLGKCYVANLIICNVIKHK